jgi:hypothetical protein
MFQKSIISIALITFTASALAAPELPFVGSRSFEDFGGAISAENQIEIKKNGSVFSSYCWGGNDGGCDRKYLGKFKPLLRDGDGYDKITASKIYLLDKFKKQRMDCFVEGKEDQPCIYKLYKD